MPPGWYDDPQVRNEFLSEVMKAKGVTIPINELKEMVMNNEHPVWQQGLTTSETAPYVDAILSHATARINKLDENKIAVLGSELIPSRERRDAGSDDSSILPPPILVVWQQEGINEYFDFVGAKRVYGDDIILEYTNGKGATLLQDGSTYELILSDGRTQMTQTQDGDMVTFGVPGTPFHKRTLDSDMPRPLRKLTRANAQRLPLPKPPQLSRSKRMDLKTTVPMGTAMVPGYGR